VEGRVTRRRRASTNSGPAGRTLATRPSDGVRTTGPRSSLLTRPEGSGWACRRSLDLARPLGAVTTGRADRTGHHRQNGPVSPRPINRPTDGRVRHDLAERGSAGALPADATTRSTSAARGRADWRTATDRVRVLRKTWHFVQAHRIGPPAAYPKDERFHTIG